MEDFGIIESGFNNADETINFGSRSSGDDNLYEISTKACMKCSQVNSNGVTEVLINSLVKNEKVFLSINNSMKIFDNKGLTTLTFNAAFESVIDSVCVSPNGKFLLICLESGMVHIFNIENDPENNCLFSKCLVKNEGSDILYIGSFIEYISYQVFSFILVSSRGKVHRVIINLKTNSGEDNLHVKSEEVYDFGTLVKTAYFSYPILFVDGAAMSLLNMENNIVSSHVRCNLKTVCSLGHKFLGLNEEGTLLKICSTTLLVFPIENLETIFEDLLVIDDYDGNKKIITVTKKNEQGESFLQLLNPDFSTIFSLKILDPVHLLLLENANDEILFISKMISDGNISELRLKCVDETEPELKLMRLIRKQRFEEAEKFANIFNINPVIILKARAQVFVDKTVCTSEDIIQLVKILELIDDEYFILQCISNVECSNHEDVRKILNYGSTIMPKGNCENKEAVLLLQRVLMDLLFKFNTYMAVYTTYDTQTWSEFSSCDLIEELKMLLKNFQVEEAIIICSRLDSVTIDNWTDEKVEEILFILNNLPASISQPFLPTFVPITMMHRPSALSIFVKWLKNRIFQLEKRDSSNFPGSGIKFAESILKLLKVEEDGYIFFQRQCSLNKEITNLARLMNALKGLEVLKKNFKINLSLEEYLMGPKTVIRTLLNTVMAPEDYECFLKDFLYIFMIQNQFDPDEIFLDEIKNLIKYDEEYWVEIVGIILKYISSVKIKLEAIKQILESARVPWCDTIREIGKSALQYSHPLVLDIKDIFDDEPILVVLRNPKYKIKTKEKQIDTINELQYAVNRIVYINEPSFIKDVYQLCKTPRDRHEVNLIVIQHLIRNGKLEEAMSILDNNSREEIYRCAEWFCSFAESAIDYQIRPIKNLRENYYNILGSLFRRLLENSDNKIYNKCFEDDLHNLRAIYNINKTFRQKLIVDDLRSSIRKKRIFEELLEEAVENFSKGSQPNIQNILTICDKLAFFFSLDKDSVLIKFCEKLEKFDVVLQAAEQLYKRESSSKHLCLIAVLLLKYMATLDTKLFVDSFNDSSDGLLIPTNSTNEESNAGIPNNNFLIGLKLSEKITQKALVNASIDDLSAVVEVMNWINNGFYLTRCQEHSLQVELFRNIHHSEHTVPGYSTFVSIRNIFDTYCGFIEKFNNPNTKYLTYFNGAASTLTEGQLLQEIQLLPEIIDNLCGEGQHLTAYKLIMTLEHGLKYAKSLDSEIIKLLNSIITKKCIPQLLNVVVSSKYIDGYLFENLLLASHKDCFKYIEYFLKLYKRQPKKLCEIASVGIKLLEYHKNTSGKSVLVFTVITCKWWNKLKVSIGNKIPYESFFKSNSDERLKQLIHWDIVDVKQIEDYCQDYNLNLQAYYMEYLKSNLINWKPDYECKMDLIGKKSLIIKNDENTLLVKCQEAIKFIKDKDAAFTMMNNILDMVNFYHYEVFICILKILSTNSKIERPENLDMPILLFLKNYRRFGSPSQSEEEQWYGTFPDSPVLDPLSEFRLPFIKMLFTPDIWNIIKPEINLKSYKYWFDATNITKNLKKDTICIYAVKEVVSSKILEDPTGNWILYPKFEDLFAEVDECVQNISDLEKATSVIYHLMAHTPYGADKVNAAQLSYKYAQKYKEQNPNSADVDKAFVKVRTKYYSFSAMHILHTFQLANEKYLHLVAQPNELIDTLYQDDRILKQAECIDLSCPDINKAVDALGALFNFHIRPIRYSLLNQWLSGTSSIDFDSTLSSTNLTNIKRTGDDNLKRATYICSSENKVFWQSYLLKVAMNDEDADISEQSFSFKAKALKCFCAISDVDTITKLTELTYKEFLNYIDKLSLLSEMECLGIVLKDVNALDQYNKKELLKRLSQVGKPIAVKIMALVCITYSIEDVRYWEYIINSAIRLGMFTELKTYVGFLKNKCYKSFYINAWQVIIENAFHLPSTLSKEEIHEAYINNFLMIQTCPVLYSLNFEKIVQKCIKTEKIEFAAVLLQFLPEERKQIYVTRILQNRAILLDLDNLSKYGIWGIRNVKSWLGSKSLL